MLLNRQDARDYDMLQKLEQSQLNNKLRNADLSGIKQKSYKKHVGQNAW